MVRKFGKFLREAKDRKFSKSSKKIENNNNYTCFECGKQGHIKSECPIYLRKHVGEKKVKDTKQKKAFIAWEDTASITSDSSSDEEIANACLMAKSMNDPSTSEEIEANPDFEELLEAFNEIQEEAQRLAMLNKKLKSELKLHINKLASIQGELNVLKQENEKLVSRCKATACDDISISFNMDDYKFLKNKFENLKKDHYAECMKLQIEFSYFKNLFGKLNKRKSDLNHVLSVQKNTTDKTSLGYNKQTAFSKKTNFVIKDAKLSSTRTIVL